MKFACLVYHEQNDAVSEVDLTAIVAECQDAAAWNEEIRKGGYHVLTAGLQSVRTAKTVRNRNGQPHITDALSPRPGSAWADSRLLKQGT